MSLPVRTARYAEICGDTAYHTEFIFLFIALLLNKIARFRLGLRIKRSRGRVTAAVPPNSFVHGGTQKSNEISRNGVFADHGGVPAFRIFSDRVLRAIASARPETASELLAVPGIRSSTVEKYGAQIYRIVQVAGPHRPR